MLVWLVLSAAMASDAASPVDVTVSWRGRTARVGFTVPDGHHVAPDAPLRADLEVAGIPWAVDTQGLAAAGGLAVPIPVTRPVPLEGTFTVSVCDDAGSSCRVVEQAVRGVLDGPKGMGFSLDAVVATQAEPEESVDFEAALAAAGSDLVLIDFGAVWCPPCNLLAAEILHDPNDADVLQGIRVVQVDADDHSSWSLKNRYAVGGYPTLVAVDSEGREVDRMVGYPGEDITKAWLQDLRTVTPLSTPPDPSTLTPEEAGAWALRFVEGQKGELAGPYFSRASEAEEHVLDARLATYLLRPSPKLAVELADGGVAVEKWGWAALSFIERKPELAVRVQDEVRKALPGASPAEAADLFYMLAKASAPEQQPDLFRAGAVTLAAGLTGDLDLDRGHLGFLSRLWENAGDLDQAAAVLDPALARWPEDMTFHEDRAELAFRTGDIPRAVSEGELAYRYGHGDNQLRALETYAQALHAAGRTEEAVAIVKEALAKTQVPADGIQVRTPRYLDALRALPFMKPDESAQ